MGAVMVIKSQTIVGIAGAFALVGGVLWGSAALVNSQQKHQGKVEIVQVPERSWTVEIKDLSAEEQSRTASAR
jgi:hypothetical protein